MARLLSQERTPRKARIGEIANVRFATVLGKHASKMEVKLLSIS